MLTPNQIEELNGLIDQKINRFVATNISPDVLTTEEIAVLRSAGVQVEKILPKDLLLYQSFAFGLISGVIPKSVLNSTNYSELKKFIGSTDMIPLNSYEKGVLRSLEKQTFKDIKGIGEKYKRTLENATITSERQYYEDVLRNKMKEGRAKKDSLRNISNEIARELDAFGRDFDRIVQTVSHQAFDEGREAFFARNYGEDARFYYEVYPGACKYCILDYLTAGIGSQPKIFKIGELPPPQVNYGKKKDDRVTTSAPNHPFCRCHKMVLPNGYEWNEEKKGFYLPKDYQPKVERKSKVKIQFNGKEYTV